MWILVGLVFIGAGLYIGFDYAPVYFYVALGIVCCVRGACVYTTRKKHRGNGKDSFSRAPPPELSKH